MNNKEYAPDKNMALWLEKGIEAALQKGTAASVPNEIMSRAFKPENSELAFAYIRNKKSKKEFFKLHVFQGTRWYVRFGIMEGMGGVAPLCANLLLKTVFKF